MSHKFAQLKIMLYFCRNKEIMPIKTGKDSPYFKDRIGEKYITNEGYEVEIIEYFGWDNCTIRFEDSCVVENVQYGDIKRGRIKNPFHKSIFGVGYFGVGEYKGSVQNKDTKQYKCWSSMLTRCYNKKHQEKIPTYIGCMVDEKWHNFQNFAEWFDDNYIKGWHLDKDILVKGNKIYSPETCCFVPSEINSLFVKCNSSRGALPIGVSKYKNEKYVVKLNKNSKSTHLGYYIILEEAFQVYKTEKEKYIKEVAEKYKDLIDPRVYQAMYNYQVEITD